MEFEGVQLSLDNLGQDLLELVVGEKWPNGDENAMRQLASEWTAAANALEQLRQEAASAARGVEEHLRGANGDAFQAMWSESFDNGASVGNGEFIVKAGSAPPALPFAIAYCQSMATALNNGANQIETTKDTIMGNIAILVATVTPQIIAGFADFGATDATAAAEIVAERTAMKVLLDAAKELIVNIVKEAFQQFLQQTELNFIIQFKEIAEGHATSFNFGELAEAGGMGALGGALGAGFGGLAGKGLAGTLGKDAAESFLGKAATGVVAGGLTNAASDLITTGHISASDFAKGSLAAVAGAGAEHLESQGPAATAARAAAAARTPDVISGDPVSGNTVSGNTASVDASSATAPADSPASSLAGTDTHAADQSSPPSSGDQPAAQSARPETQAERINRMLNGGPSPADTSPAPAPASAAHADAGAAAPAPAAHADAAPAPAHDGQLAGAQTAPVSAHPDTAPQAPSSTGHDGGQPNHGAQPAGQADQLNQMLRGSGPAAGPSASPADGAAAHAAGDAGSGSGLASHSGDSPASPAADSGTHAPASPAADSGARSPDTPGGASPHADATAPRADTVPRAETASPNTDTAPRPDAAPRADTASPTDTAPRTDSAGPRADTAGPRADAASDRSAAPASAGADPRTADFGPRPGDRTPSSDGQLSSVRPGDDAAASGTAMLSGRDADPGRSGSGSPGDSPGGSPAADLARAADPSFAGRPDSGLADAGAGRPSEPRAQPSGRDDTVSPDDAASRGGTVSRDDAAPRAGGDDGGTPVGRGARDGTGRGPRGDDAAPGDRDRGAGHDPQGRDPGRDPQGGDPRGHDPQGDPGRDPGRDGPGRDAPGWKPPRDPGNVADHLTDISARADDSDHGSSFFSGDEHARDLTDMSREVPPDPGGAHDMNLHGDEVSGQVDGKPVTAQDIVDLANAHGREDGQPIRLTSCDAGKLDDGLAAEVARLGNCKVIAADSRVWTDEAGHMFASDGHRGEDGNLAPDIPPTGHWHEFSPDGTKTQLDDNGFPPGQEHGFGDHNAPVGKTLSHADDPHDDSGKSEEGNAEKRPAEDPASDLTPDNSWPPAKPATKKPKIGDEGADVWRYNRYRWKAAEGGKGQEEILSFEDYKRLHYDEVSQGKRPGRRGGPAQVAMKEHLSEHENVQEVENLKLGDNNFPDGVRRTKNAEGGTDYFEVGQMLNRGHPESRERGKLQNEIDALGPHDTITFVDKNDKDRRITYRKGDKVEDKNATIMPRPDRKGN